MQLKKNKEMEFETLKKSYKKQIITGALAICVIGGALTFNLTRAKYKITESIDLAKGTINYKPYDFKIMAMYKSEDGTNYTELNDRMPSSGYVINESKSYCTMDNKNKDTNAKLYTYQGKHVFESLAKSDKCYLYFDKYETPTASDIILTSVTINKETPDFSSKATTDEGVYSASDGMYGGTSYYWRGAVTNNYVKFAGFCWRIVRISGDKTMRLIYDGSSCHANGTSTNESIAKTSVAYNSISDQSNYVGWTYIGTSQRTISGTFSNARLQLDNWYSSSISETNVIKIANGYFCNDRNTASGYSWAISPSSTFYYAAYKRMYTDHQPTFSCPLEDRYTLKVGLITIDEAKYAGGSNGTNTSYYLYNGQFYWTMTPSYWFGTSHASEFAVDNSGGLNNANLPATYGIRPVINLHSDIKFSSGDGTQYNPYIVQ